MCAPGEHHLAVLAGWDSRLAWGMAAVLAAYAGIATSVAGTRPRGVPGHRSAAAGAVVSLSLAMSAQPVSHMFVTGHWSADPRAPEWLVWVVSCVPPLVLGHLLHLAATPVPRAERAGTAVPQAGGQPRRVPRRFVATGRVVLPGPTAIPVSVPVVLAPSAAASRAVTEPRRKARTTAQVAEDHGVKPDTVRKWVARGVLTPLPERDSGGGHLFAPDATPKLSVATG
ncbi:hypothetical protein [Embleya sp. NPDC005971]|uniref:hypothetical protein n=1 Tax=Embleya sp. NPDC005971 TaxID=3156724 RepID=UPI0033E84656